MKESVMKMLKKEIKSQKFRLRRPRPSAVQSRKRPMTRSERIKNLNVHLG